jgi:hypothetical protein
MLNPVKIKDYMEIEDIEIENTNFKSLDLKEEHSKQKLSTVRAWGMIPWR